MEDFLFSVNVVAPLFILIAAGYILRHIHLISENFLFEANKFVFKLCLPLMLFQNIQKSFQDNFINTRIIWVSLIGVLFVIIISTLIVMATVKKQGQRGSMIQGIYRSNFLIYGLPLATGIYGEAAIAPISLLMGAVIPLFNVAAVIILSVFSEKNDHRISFKEIIKDILKNPLIIGCACGAIAGYFNFHIPKLINDPLTDFAGIATPLALFVMGGEFKFRSLKQNFLKVIFVTFARLILVPLAALFICIQMGFRNIELSILLCLFATPTAVSSYIMAKNMGCDGELSGQIVVLTTIVSCVTIFFFIFFLRYFSFI